MNQLTKGKIILYLGGIFLAGAICGAVTAFGVTKRSSSRPPTMEKVSAHIRKEFQSRLNLTPEQWEKINPSLNKSLCTFREIHHKAMDEIERVIQASNEEIAKALTPEQQKKLAEMDLERRARMQKYSSPDDRPRPATH